LKGRRAGREDRHLAVLYDVIHDVPSDLRVVSVAELADAAGRTDNVYRGGRGCGERGDGKGK
jgi:hypothetical protein